MSKTKSIWGSANYFPLTYICSNELLWVIRAFNSYFTLEDQWIVRSFGRELLYDVWGQLRILRKVVLFNSVKTSIHLQVGQQTDRLWFPLLKRIVNKKQTSDWFWPKCCLIHGNIKLGMCVCGCVCVCVRVSLKTQKQYGDWLVINDLVWSYSLTVH